MKLISCHIENFGVLHDRDIAFADGINSFVLANGAGKSTLAAFLRAMLFGMATASAKSREFTDREHYFPFSGGAFGGSLTFEWKGEIWRIERFFDSKSSPRDELKLECGGKPVPEPEGGIGRAVFGVDETSFARILYVTAEPDEEGIPAELGEKLNLLVGRSGALPGALTAEAAAAKLENAAKKIVPQRGSGLLREKKKELAELREEIRNLSRIGAGLPGKYEKRAALNAEYRALADAAAAEKNRRYRRGLWEIYDRTCADAEKNAEEVRRITGKYPHGIPTAEETAALEAALSALRQAEADRQAAVFPPDREERLAALTEKYPLGLPDPESADRLAALGAELARVRAERAGTRLSPADEARRETLAARFASGLPDAGSMERVRAALEELSSRNGAADHLRLAVEADKNEKYRQLSEKFSAGIDPDERQAAQDAAGRLRAAEADAAAAAGRIAADEAALAARRTARADAAAQKKKRLLLPFLIGTLLLIAGLALLFVSTPAGAALTAAGGILVIVCALRYSAVGRAAQAYEAPADGTAHAALIAAENGRQAAAAELRAFLGKFGYSSARPLDDWALFLDDTGDLADLRDQLASDEAALAEQEAAISGLNRDADRFLDGFCCPPGSPAERLRALEGDAAEYRRLLRAAREADEAQARLSARAAELEADAAELLRPYGLAPTEELPALAARLRADAAALSSLKNEKERTDAAAHGAETRRADAGARFAAVTAKYELGEAPDPEAAAAFFRGAAPDRERLRSAAEARDRAAAAAERTAAENALTDRAELGDPDAPAADPDVLEEAARGKMLELSRFDRLIEADEENAGLLPEKEDAADRLEAEIGALDERARLLRRTAELIRRADENLRSRIISPVRDIFLGYAARLEAVLGEKMSMDTDCRVSFERGGKRRSNRHLSAGERSLCSLCLRLALAENLYRDGERPLILLDDPFVHLDPEHLRKAADVLAALSGNYQILYFCCHPDRDLHSSTEENEK